MSDFELAFVEWLRAQDNSEFRIKNSEFSCPIGDDMAIFETPPSETGLPGGMWLMSSDMLLDGVHFETATQPLAQIGRKAIACSLSDCAAMAVRPVAATVSLALPKNVSLDQAKELMGGMLAIADEFKTQIVGGDTTRWDHPLAIDVAIFAQPYEGTGKAGLPVEPVLRSGARHGDALYVTGSLGGSRLAGTKNSEFRIQNSEFSTPGHLTFTPRVREARLLAKQFGSRLHAMIDISDGLSLDLWRLCRASGVGATLSEADLESVISDEARRASELDGKSPLDHVLGDGEDYELLLAISGDMVESPVTLHRIGQVTEGDVVLQGSDGKPVIPIEPKGYVH